MDDRTTHLDDDPPVVGRSDERAGDRRDAPDDAGGSFESSRAADRRDTDDAVARTREIRAEIEQTRGDLSETIDAIQDKLRPGNLVSEATERVRAATTEKVRDMADTAGNAAGGFIERIKNNPVPAALAGIGLAWLAFSDRGESRYRSAEYDRGYGTRPIGTSGREYASESYGTRNTPYGVGDSPYGARDVAFGGTPDDETGLTDRVASKAQELASRAQDVAGTARDRVYDTTRRAQNGFERLLNDNPLLVGAAALVVGAAVGAALPQTERENQLMGEARDNVVDGARQMARDAADKVQEVADKVQNVAGDVSNAATAPKSTDRKTKPGKSE
jgi:ElaB/YqjD/DUF883 family membrane-anchored ribosome-binding protein